MCEGFDAVGVLFCTVLIPISILIEFVMRAVVADIHLFYNSYQVIAPGRQDVERTMTAQDIWDNDRNRSRANKDAGQ